ncbi:apolipoprotein B receptor [Sciurus carolinensis]|uniref:apolipoprotein B receptor n=1 Tax=Sciurus carolinensis TaxID=30640 RepID=UPI001FB455DA|nr:apolipoprotein B receptor [Sciurus carolinensis]
MDFLRLHLPGLHQALRGALDSFNAFLFYLMGDEVPTVEQEAQAAKELREVAAGKPEKTREEEAQETLEGLRDSQSRGSGKPGGSGEAGRCLEGSSAAEQTWGWGKGSSHGSQADGQDTGTWKAARAFRDQEPSAPLEARKKSEAGSRAQQDRSSQSQERQEPSEQEVNRGETLRTWEQEEEEEEEEEEEVRATEPGMARGVESEWTWHREPEVKAGADSGETEQVVPEAVAETEGSGTRGPGREEEGLVVVRSGQSIRTQGTGVESEGWATLGREEARITSSGREEVWTDLAREEADLPGVRGTEYGPVSGERIPEATGKLCALDKATKEVQEKEVKRETEVKLFPRQTQALGTEETEEAAEGQTAEREAAEGRESEEEAGECFEGEINQHGKEADGRQDLQFRADGVGLEEEVHAEEGRAEEGSCLASEAELALDKEARDDSDLEAVPEARSDEFVEERSKEAQRSQEVLEEEWDDLKHRVTEDQEPELMGGVLTPTEQPEEEQGFWEELGRVSDLRKEEMERRLEECYRHTGSVDPEVPAGEAWGNQRRRDRGSRNSQEVKTDAEDGEEEATGGQALEAKAKGDWESELPEIQRCVTEEGEAFVAENQELQGSPGEEAGIGQSLEQSEARETEDSKVEASVPREADLTSRGGWRLQEAALGLQDHEDTQTSSLVPEIVEDEAVLVVRAAGTEEGSEWEAGAVWVEEYGREEAEGEAELVEAAGGENGDGQDFGLEASAEKEMTGRAGEGEALEAREGEPAEVGGPAVAEEGGGMEDVISGSQAARAEDAVAIVEAEGLPGEQPLLEEEAGAWQAREQRKDGEGQHGDHHPEGEAQRLLDVEDTGTGGQRPEAKETDPEGLEDVQDQEGQPTQQALVEALPGPSETETAGSARGDTHSGWCEDLLPGSRLDVSVPRSRVLLSRSSSQRRSRPSFRRTLAPEQPEDPPSPQPEEGLSDPEQRPLQLEETPEPSPPRPEGTPVPARRKPLGHGFGLAHPGMMQELQARLGRPKPQ